MIVTYLFSLYYTCLPISTAEFTKPARHVQFAGDKNKSYLIVFSFH